MSKVERVLAVVQHTESEFLGGLEPHFEQRNIGFNYIRPCVGEDVPGTSFHFDGVIFVGGGAWGTVTDERILPSLDQELRLARDCLRRNKPVIGIGAGAQILCMAAGGTVEPSPLVMELYQAQRCADGALGGYLPESFPFCVYGRDRVVLPDGAQVLADDGAGQPLLFQIGDNCFGFAGHPGAKSGIYEDLLMEFNECPENTGEVLEHVRLVQHQMAEALSSMMVGIIQATKLMRPRSETDKRAKNPILVARS